MDCLKSSSALASAQPPHAATPGTCRSDNNDPGIASILDRRRALAAQITGVDLEFSVAIGDLDGARRAMHEMYAQIEARRASTFAVAERA